MKIVSNGKTIEVGGGSDGEVYATEERQIGTWLGKPLYRKSYDMHVPAIAVNQWALIAPPIDGIDTIVTLRAIMERIDGFVSPVPFLAGTQYMVSISYAKTALSGIPKGLLLYTTNSLYSNCKYNIVIEYTKTTD